MRRNGKAELGDRKAGMKEIWEEMEGQEGGGFESTAQQLPDKLVFPGTPRERSARKRIMLCTNLSEVILQTSLSIV